MFQGHAFTGKEFRIITKDGQIKWCLSSWSPLFDEKGNPIGVQGRETDISERKRAEEAILKSQQMLEKTFASLREAVFIIDANTVKIIDCNPSATKIFGYSRHEMLERTTTFLHVDDSALEEFRRHLYSAIKEKGFLFLPEFKMKRKDGTVFDTEHHVSSLEDERGNRIGWVSVVRDITEQKHAEEALRRSEKSAKGLAQENAIMAEIGRIISSTLNIEEVYERFAEEVCKLIPSEGIAINIINHKEGTMTIPYVSGITVPERQRGATFRLEGSVAEEIMRTRSAVIVQTEDKNELQARFPTLLPVFEKGFRSVIAVPLISKDQVIGNIHFRSAKPKAYSDQDLRLAERVSNQIAGAIANAQLFAERKQAEEALQRNEETTKQLAKENAIMAEIGRIVSSTLNIEEVYEKFAEEVRKLIPFDRLAVNIINPEDNTATVTYVSGVEIKDHHQRDVFPLSGTVTEAVIRSQSGLIIQEKNESEIATRFPRFSLSIHFGLKSTILVPLIYKDRSIGVLNFRTFRPNAYTEADLRLAERIGNQVTGAIANAQLFAERKKAEESLRTEKQRLQTLSEQAPFGMVMIDQDGTFRYINPKFTELFGYDLSDIPDGKTWFRKAYPDPTYRHHVIETWIKDLESLKPGDKRSEVFTVTCKDGTEKIINFIPVQLETCENLMACEDITERKLAEEALRKSEAKFQRLFNEAPMGYMALDTEGRITEVNHTEIAMLDYTAEEMIGQPVWKFIVQEEEARQTIMAKLSGLMSTGKAFERAYRRKDGTTVPVLIEDAFLRDAEGRVIGIHSIVQDITERKQAEEEKVALQEQLRQSQKIEAIGQLAGGIAHDFNNLLTVIKGYSQLSLFELKEGDPLKGNIEEIQKASQRATDLTRQLLAFSRRQILDFKVLDLNMLLQDLDKMLRRILGEDVELIYGLAEGLGKVKTDPGQIEQVIMNLAVNARDAMPSGGKLIIETANVELNETYARTHIGVTPGQYVMVSVSDTGCGMSLEVKEHIFEPFFTTKEKGRGTGLGLSTVYGIVKQSGGYIWVDSKPSCGTIFKIYLPRVEEEASVFRQRENNVHLLYGDETILLVEDEQSLRGLAVRVLRELGYTLLEAANGEEALHIVQEQNDRKINLLLTDVVMPQMDGKELADQLKILHPDIKVLFISGYTDNAIVHHGVLEPGTNFLQKPFSPAALTQKVREVLDS